MATWKEFKEAMEKNGIRDETEIEYIDVVGNILEGMKILIEDGCAKVYS